ncbi:hypothetical protein FQN55_003977 [Onygenales sp. PD_40]|nr:hypothetical protein FQN55_003977 [Onygenales sp. PD_40]KAK2786985.1 hypothetical protein FQN52_007427 [Onygenales sp. PD_12]
MISDTAFRILQLFVAPPITLGGMYCLRRFDEEDVSMDNDSNKEALEIPDSGAAANVQIGGAFHNTTTVLGQTRPDDYHVSVVVKPGQWKVQGLLDGPNLQPENMAEALIVRTPTLCTGSSSGPLLLCASQCRDLILISIVWITTPAEHFVITGVSLLRPKTPNPLALNSLKMFDLLSGSIIQTR